LTKGDREIQVLLAGNLLAIRERLALVFTLSATLYSRSDKRHKTLTQHCI